ncbi:MAG: peptidoglycan-binding protein [bacterium]|nr:peptidoglycan-binding protein [bacterium]
MNKFLAIVVLICGVTISGLVSAQADVDPNPSESTCVTLNSNMRYRDRDSNTNGEVSTLQDFLQSKGYLSTEPTGYFGLLTFKAVKYFQNENGIVPASGYVGHITRAKITEVTCANSSAIILQSSSPSTNYGNQISNNSTSTGLTSAGGNSLTISTSSSLLLSGCTSTQGYSTTTGLACNGSQTTTPTLPGCTSSSGYSSITGLACDGSQAINPALPSGCVSFQGYSTTTGLACNV